MASHDTLEFLRTRLVKDIADLLCKPCTEARKSQRVTNYEDPLRCACRCDTIEPLIERLGEVERALKISAEHLS